MKSDIFTKAMAGCHLSSNAKGHGFIACRVSPQSCQGAEPGAGPQGNSQRHQWDHLPVTLPKLVRSILLNHVLSKALIIHRIGYAPALGMLPSQPTSLPFPCLLPSIRGVGIGEEH